MSLPPDLLRLAEHHRRRQQEIARRLARLMASMWRRVDAAAPLASWQVLPAVQAMTMAQLAAADGATAYVSAALALQDADPAAGQVAPASLAGVASDGRPLDTLLMQPALEAEALIAAGAVSRLALLTGAKRLNRIVVTQVADASRVATGVATTGAPGATGYIRMLTPPSCSRCVILAGKRYEWNAGFKRHPRCFPAGVLVSGPRSEAATRRLYQGELVVLATASGQKLALTGNHPVLTGRGWIPANLLQEGDEVVRSTRPEGAAALVVPDHDQVPSRIEDVWGSLGVPFLDAMESSPEDFHGDGQHGKVDVVRADRPFDDRFLAALLEHGPQGDLARTARSAIALDGQGPAELLDLADAALTGGPVSFDNLGLPLLGGLGLGAHEPGFAHATALHSGFGEDARDWAARGAVLLREPVFAGPAEVGLDDLGSGQGEHLSRWDAPGDSFSVETRGGYAARGLDLLQRLAGQVELDRLVEVRRVEWSGHVYSLTSSEGWHSANSLIVSNCDCVHIPAAENLRSAVTSPQDYFDSLSEAEQNKVFTIAGAHAIRDGADISQVVNARRGGAGLSPAGARLTAEELRILRRERGRLERVNVFGRDLFVTTEGTTVRGTAGVRLSARETGTRRDGSRYRTARAPRLMPESIYEIAENREDAIRLLKRYGYLL